MAPTTKLPSQGRVMGLFVLIALNMAVITNLRNLPLVAAYGWGAISFYLLSALFFLMPTALISAELATGWPKAGGIYIWVREALGERLGFLAIWLQWVHNLPWYPAALTFIGTLIAYSLGQFDLIHNKIYMISIIILGFWGVTFLNFLGIKISGIFSTLCVVIGVVVPAILLIGFGFYWIFQELPSEISLKGSWGSLFPDITSLHTVALLTGLYLEFSGLEVTAVYAKEVKEPQRNYPKGIFIAAALTLLVFMLGSLFISLVVPLNEVCLVAGLMDAYHAYLKEFHLEGWLPFMSFLIALGALAELNTWVSAPSQGLFITARHGSLPPFFQKVNKRGVPTTLLLVQAVIVTFCSIIFYFMKSLSAAYWVLIAISAMLYIIMYLLLFLAGIVLRYKKPLVHRHYRIGKTGNFWMWVVALLGLIGGVFAFIVGFFPPPQLEIQHKGAFVLILLISILVFSAIPFLIYHSRKPSWKTSLKPLHEE